MRVPSSASLMLALAGFGGICACAVVGRAFDPLETVPAAVVPERDPGASAGANAPVGNPLWAVPLSALFSTGERPIFSPSRRPPAPPVAGPSLPPPQILPPPVPQETDRPLLLLVGTAVGGSKRLGVFLEESTKKLVRIEQGQGHGGWSLRSLDRREAQFEKAHRAAILALRAAPAEVATNPLGGSVPTAPPVGPRATTGSVAAPAAPPTSPPPATASLGASATEPVPAVYHRKR